jgi:uncharacterized protein
MLVHLEDIPPEGLEVELVMDPDDPAVRDMEIRGPVKGTLKISKTGHQVLVRGRVNGQVQLTCARCLTDFTVEIDEEVDVELRPAFDLDRDARERELGSDDLDVEFFRGDALDVGHLAAEQVSLAIPMKPLCREECAGICPQCGADRVAGSCSCEPDTDPRWSALKDLKSRIDDKK